MWHEDCINKGFLLGYLLCSHGEAQSHFSSKAIEHTVAAPASRRVLVQKVSYSCLHTNLLLPQAEDRLSMTLSAAWNAVLGGSQNETALHMFGVEEGQCPPGTFWCGRLLHY